MHDSANPQGGSSILAMQLLTHRQTDRQRDRETEGMGHDPV